MDTPEIQPGSLVEVIRTGAVTCVLEHLSSSTVDNKDKNEQSLKAIRILAEDGKIYGIDQIRTLPGNTFL